MPLEAALELTSASLAGDSQLREFVGALAAGHASIAMAERAFEGRTHYVGPYDKTTIEIRQTPRSARDMELQWIEHRRRFALALTRGPGLHGDLAKGVAKAYEEMVDNVLEHAAPPDAPVPPAVMGFHVTQRAFTFAVADLGQGVVASLRASPAHRAVASDHEALDAAVRRGATRREHSRSGTGFRTLHEALADLRCVLRFRTGSGSLVLDGAGRHREVLAGVRPALIGFQLSVTCDLGKHGRRA